MDKPRPASPHSHDHIAKLFLGDPVLFADFLTNYGDSALIPRLNFQTLRREPAAVVNGRLTERISDLRFRCEFLGSRLPLEAFLFLEHQSTPQRHIPLRILGYVFDAYTSILSQVKKGKSRRLLPYPLAIVLYHGKMPWRGALTMRELIGVPVGVNPFILDFPLLLVDVPRMTADRLKGSRVLQSLLMALGANAAGNFEQSFPEIMEKLAASDKNTLLRERMDAMTYYAVGRCHNQDSYNAVRTAYERAFGMKEGDKMAKTLAEQWVDEGIEKGMEKGIEKGMEKGMEKGRENAAATVVKILSSRFGVVPAVLEKRIKKTGDLEDLQRLAVMAATAESMTEFKRSLADIKTASKK